MVFGPLAITYNLPVDFLVLDAQTLAGIFNGSITRWDDPSIISLNASMPSEDIHVIYRSDNSGSTANFQAYLQAAAGGAWTQGTGKAFKGGAGIGAKGNDGTSSAVKNTEGAITYNELSFAMERRTVRRGDQDPGQPQDQTPGPHRHRLRRQDHRRGQDRRQGQRPRARPLVVLQPHPGRRLSDRDGDLRDRLLEIPRPADRSWLSRPLLQATLGPGQIDLDKNGYIPLPPDFQAKVSGAADAIS